MRSRRVLRAGAICRGVWRTVVHCEAGMLGAGGAVQCGKARVDEWNWRMPECWRDLYRVHDAGISGQVYAVYESAAWFVVIGGRGDDIWKGDTCVEEIYAGVVE